MTFVLASLLAGAAARAQDLAAYRAASDRFAALVGAATKPAELDTAEVDTLIRVLGDEQRFLPSRKYTVDDIGNLLDLCDMTNKASVSLLLFDVKSHVAPSDTQQQAAAKIVKLQSGNVLAFQDELEELMPFLLRCQARSIPPITEFFVGLPQEQRTDVRMQGLRGARSGIVNIFVGSLQSATDEGLRQSFRLALTTALAETAPQLAAILPLPARRRLSAAIAAAPRASGEIAARLDQAAAALNDSRCEGLCAFD